MQVTQKYLDELTYSIIRCAIEVHKQVGPGLLESVYEKCFTRELHLSGLNYISQ
jgi:GxxExxY protein